MFPLPGTIIEKTERVAPSRNSILDQKAVLVALSQANITLKKKQMDHFYRWLHRYQYPASLPQFADSYCQNLKKLSFLNRQRQQEFPKPFLDFLRDPNNGFTTITSSVVNRFDDGRRTMNGVEKNKLEKKRKRKPTCTRLIIELHDGLLVETTINRYDNRKASICVSSQCGCAMGCNFCPGGVAGLRGNLTSAEILEQVIHAYRILMKEYLTDSDDPDEEISVDVLQTLVNNVVFMGTGEPLANYSNVVQACRVLKDKKRWGLDRGRITVSTIGIIPNMRKLTVEMPDIILALSLHAPNQRLREAIVPMAVYYPIEDLLATLDNHTRAYIQDKYKRYGSAVSRTVAFNTEDDLMKRFRRTMIEYLMLDGETSSPECAHELGKLCEKRPLVVNLVPYSYIGANNNNNNLQTPTEDRIKEFQQIVSSYGVLCHIRRSLPSHSMIVPKSSPVKVISTKLLMDIENLAKKGIVVSKKAGRKKSTKKKSFVSIHEPTNNIKTYIVRTAVEDRLQHEKGATRIESLPRKSAQILQLRRLSSTSDVVYCEAEASGSLTLNSSEETKSSHGVEQRSDNTVRSRKQNHIYASSQESTIKQKSYYDKTTLACQSKSKKQAVDTIETDEERQVETIQDRHIKTAEERRITSIEEMPSVDSIGHSLYCIESHTNRNISSETTRHLMKEEEKTLSPDVKLNRKRMQTTIGCLFIVLIFFCIVSMSDIGTVSIILLGMTTLSSSTEEDKQYQASKMVQTRWRTYKTMVDYQCKRNSIRKIQTFGRSYLARRCKHNYIACVCICQAVVRRFIIICRWKRMKRASIVLQTKWRTYQCTSELQLKRNCAKIIQAFARSYLAVRLDCKKKACTILIQSLVRKHLMQKDFLFRIQSRRASTMLQAAWRGYREKSLYRQKKVKVLVIQSYVRRFLRQQKFSTLFDQISLCQSVISLQIAECKSKRMALATTMLQTRWRAHRDKSSYQDILTKAVTIQSISRGYLKRKKFCILINHVTLCQSVIRRFIAGSRWKQMKQGATLIQMMWRAFLKEKQLPQDEKIAKAAAVIQSIIRTYLVQRRFAILTNYASICQSVIRRHLEECRWEKMRRASTILQIWWRMKMEDMVSIQSNSDVSDSSNGPI